MWRWHPQTRLARELVADGAIGTLRGVRAALTVPIPAEDIRRSRELGGGALGDLGCYCVSAIRLFAGQPEQVYAVGLNDAEDVEMRVSATCHHRNGVLSQFGIGFDLTRRDQLELIGTDGSFALTETEADVYRIEIEEVSNAIAGVSELEFGRHDALDQVAAIAAIRQSAQSGKPVSL